MCIVVWFSFSLSPHLYLSLFMPVSFFLHMSVSLSSQICLCLSLFIWLSSHVCLCLSLFIWLSHVYLWSLFTCLPVVLGVCGCVCCVCWCVVVCWAVRVVVVCAFKTLPCVRSIRSRVYFQKRPCQIGHGRFERTHGILNVHTGASLSLVFSRISPLVSPSLFSSLSLASHTSLFFSLAISARLSLSLVCSTLFLSLVGIQKQ